MSIKVAINGFGRIGKNTFRVWAEQENSNFEIVALNGIGNIDAAILSLKYDSVFGQFKGDVEKYDGGIVVNGKKIAVSNFRKAEDLPWGKLGIDILIEATGAYRTREKADLHVKAGAKKVVISAPAKGEDKTIVLGVNEQEYDPKNHNIISNASCTTNCLAPVAKVLDDVFGIEEGLMTTIHAYTNDQNILDGEHSDARRSRAAALSMIPTTTGAAEAVSLVMPQLKGRLTGMAVRVPTPTVSLVDLVVKTKKPANAETVNAALKAASESGALKGYLGYSELPLVSIDYKQDPRSSIVDSLATLSVGDNLVKVVSWYDNEWGYSARMVDLVSFIVDKGL